ncbi:Uncharacterized protein OBRU01_03864 [Operophtera brumata]|uniref:Uncharacterized protein n=1 Tax=Operophtera brumata TaxID=104452 RepID=A0A0L7LLT6_OPEBR|nr:Uncharacterized protein OBRU01_03864 [Operophtera brumata]
MFSSPIVITAGCFTQKQPSAASELNTKVEACGINVNGARSQQVHGQSGIRSQDRINRRAEKNSADLSRFIVKPRLTKALASEKILSWDADGIWEWRRDDHMGGENKRSRSGSTMGGLRSYFRMVSEHKDVVRAVMALQGMMYMFKPDIEKLLKTYGKFANVWAEDRVHQIQNFVDSNPLNVIVGDMLKTYEAKTEEILRIPERHIIGSIQINMDNVKLGLHIESIEWKRILGKLLSIAYKERVNKMMQFINDRMKVIMDMELDLIIESYDLFAQFSIDVPKEDADMVYGLRYAFQNMLLTKELTQGVSSFLADVLKFDADYELNGPLTPGLTAREASDRVIMFQSRFDDLWRKFEMYSTGEKLFGMEVKDYPILHQRKKDLGLLSKLYSLYLSVMNSIDGYFETPWSGTDIELIVTQLADFDLRCRKLPKAMKDWAAYIELKKKIDDFNETCPLLELMADKAMKDRHWSRLEKLMNCVLDVESESFTLANIMEAPLLQNKEDVEDICISAVKEKDIEAKLKQVIADWAVVDLTFGPFKNRGELLLRAQDTLDIITLLEDTMMVLNSLSSNRYNAPFKKDIMLWINKVVGTTEILEKWLAVQNLWMYLEAVFVGGDISKQLPAEAKRFGVIDKTYVKIMYRARDIVNCVETCTVDDSLKHLLPHLFEQLEACQKSLTGYLETKRLIFPRFFFVSDPPHLPSIFDALYTVSFDDKDRIIAINSDNGETIPLDKIVSCMGGVELWLNSLLDSMKDAVRNIIALISQAMASDPEFEFLVAFWHFPGQILWTVDSEYALKKSKADKFIMRITNQRWLDLLNGLIDMTVRDLTSLDRTRVETMITIHVHQRDIFDDLVRMRIKTPVDFEWQKQARFYYLEDSDDCIVSITDVDFIYQYIVLNEIKETLHVSLLITVVGEATYSLMCDLCSPVHPETKTFDELVKLPHWPDKCRFAQYNCDECGVRGHLKVMCKTRRDSGALQNYVSDDEGEDFFNIQVDGTGDRPYIITIESFEFEVDTGSRISTISENCYQRNFPKKVIQPDYLNLRCYVGSKMDSLGFIDVDLVLGNVSAPGCRLHVIRNGGRPLLGREWMRALRIKNITIDMHAISDYVSDPFVNRLAAEFPEVFTENTEIGNKNLGKTAERFLLDKFSGKASNVDQWIHEYENECTRFEIIQDAEKIETLKHLLEKHKNIIKQIHENMCHIGIKQMQKKIGKHYTAKNLIKNINDVCKRCETCIKN